PESRLAEYPDRRADAASPCAIGDDRAHRTWRASSDPSSRASWASYAPSCPRRHGHAVLDAVRASYPVRRAVRRCNTNRSRRAGGLSYRPLLGIRSEIRVAGRLVTPPARAQDVGDRGSVAARNALTFQVR